MPSMCWIYSFPLQSFPLVMVGDERAQVTADGVPVLWHDDYVVTRAPGGSLEQQHVAQLTLAGFKRLARPAPRGGAPVGAGAGAGAAGALGGARRGAPPAEAACRADGGGPELVRLFNDGAGGRAAAPAPWVVEEDDELPTLAEVFEARLTLPCSIFIHLRRARRAPSLLGGQSLRPCAVGCVEGVPMLPCRYQTCAGQADPHARRPTLRPVSDTGRSASVGHGRAASDEAGRSRAPGRAGGRGFRHRGQAGDAGQPGGHARRRGRAHGRPDPGRGALPCSRGTLCANAPCPHPSVRGALPTRAAGLRRPRASCSARQQPGKPVPFCLACTTCEGCGVQWLQAASIGSGMSVQQARARRGSGYALGAPRRWSAALRAAAVRSSSPPSIQTCAGAPHYRILALSST